MTIETPSTLVIRLNLDDVIHLLDVLRDASVPVSIKEADMKSRLVHHLETFLREESSKSRTQYD